MENIILRGKNASVDIIEDYHSNDQLFPTETTRRFFSGDAVGPKESLFTSSSCSQENNY